MRRLVAPESARKDTHEVRAYTDGFLAFNINRDNATTSGDALICVSGYLV